ncbi:ATPase [Defluviimonas sp. 20V17]|uniref:ATPase n=1 Tax=Allgaiera indica TaxID=765699 RepID=A0AAN4UV21_9RHOB|nr:AAA family ATPase [Allgaiera indica]KDB04389.1 ATPase [Defluviimonas sp. 20V17]GHE06231.1 ATPase [Allgaiera indica]SDX88845.1 Predicted ATPase [Allgaiera indica]
MTREETPSRHVILSGCSGGGKSTLLAELGRRGFEFIEEPGRRIVAEEIRSEGSALPWVDPEAFARKAFDMASRDRACVKGTQGWVFFDRGLIDAAIALEHATGIAASRILGGQDPFHRRVFLTPPWPEIYKQDNERRHNMKDGILEYRRLLAAFDRLGYETIILPKIDVEARTNFVLERLS